jgi:PAS domain S-box-containing protein
VAWGSTGAIVFLLLAPLLFQTVAYTQAKEIRRVLIFNELGPWSPGVNAINEEIFATLHNSPYQIEFYIESLDTSLFPDENSQRRFRDWYFRKYQDRKPDLILAIGPSPLKFMTQSHDVFSPGTPVVFWASTEQFAKRPLLGPEFTGVWGVAQPGKTLEVALQLRPGTKHVVVVGGVAPYDRYLEALVKEAFRGYEQNLDFTYLTDLAMPDLLERLKHLPSNTIVYHTSIMLDAAGTHFTDATQSVPMVASAANAPVFAVDDVDVGGGMVGGYVFSFDLAGRLCAGMAARILNGDRPQDIPVVSDANVYLFDWRALQRWGMSEKNLPPSRVVLNRPASFWQLYEKYVFPGIIALLAQALAIIALLWQRARRRKVQVDLVRSNERLRMAMESGKSVAWEWDVRTGRNSWFGDLPTMFGISSNTFDGNEGDLYRFIHPEDLQRVSEAVSDARKNRKTFVMEFRVIPKGGTARWVVSRGIFEYARNGDARRMLGMAVDITERKETEDALIRSEQRSKQLVLRSPVAMIVTRDPLHQNETVNLKFTEVFGYTIEDLQDEPHWWILAFPDEAYREAVKAEWHARQTGATSKRTGIEPMEARVQCKDGSSRYVEFHFAALGDSVLVSFIDLTDRQLAEDALRESEERFRLVANAAPVMIWMSGKDKLCDYFNRTWLDFTGRSLEAELGNGWAEGVHADDSQNCWSIYAGAFDQRNPFAMEYRLRRHDGEYRWLLDLGVPRFNPDSSFAGYIGCAIDVTVHKEAEEALSSVSRRLIEAHEEERTWIARELHDDINQRIALLAVHLRTLQQNLPSTEAYTSQGLEEAYERASELGSDVQAMSHHLHSSKLDYLGLVAAAKSVCKEISRDKNVEIAFHSEDVPRDLPKEVSLCLFRVLQEAIQNAVKHSRSRHIEASLTATPTEIQLSVHDSGIGFEPEKVVSDHGLGLTSMKERLKLVGGWLSVESKPEWGTTILARVPLGRMGESTSAVG